MEQVRDPINEWNYIVMFVYARNTTVLSQPEKFVSLPKYSGLFGLFSSLLLGL